MATITDQRWIDWTDNFLTLPREPLDKVRSGVLVGVSKLDALLEMTPPELLQPHVERMRELLDKLYAEPRGQLFKITAAKLDLAIGVSAMLFLLSWADTPASTVMYVHVTKRIEQLLGRPVSLEDLCLTYFPTGLVPEADQMKAWELQKDAECVNGNYLDSVVA